MPKVLLIVDVQNEYFPGGKVVLDGSVRAAQRIRVILEAFRAERLPVVFIQHISPRPGLGNFQAGSRGIEIYPEIVPADGEKVIVKHYPNSFRETGLDDHLKRFGADRLAIVGMMTQMCIDTTTRAAFDLGYNSTVISDCCAAKALSIDGLEIDSETVHRSFLAALRGTFAAIVDSASYLEREFNQKS